MAQLEPAFDYLMELEGGGETHTVEGDPGGATKWGISQRAHPEIDIDALTREQAREIYRQDYWDAIRGDEIHSQVMAEEIFEMAANAGIPSAVRVAQAATNDVLGASRQSLQLVVDGIMGPRTLHGLNTVDAMGAVAEVAWDGRFNLRQLKYYRNLDPALVDKFFVGWTRRIA